jgi:hypothetical protein
MLNYCTVIGATVVFFLQLCAADRGWGEQAGSVIGLWRLAGIMPAGVPTEEIPEGLTDRYFYWFYGDGTLALLQETEEGKTSHRGAWKQKENEIVITWENGVQNLVRVVKIGENYMILTGIGVAPLWFRFVRYF